METHCSHRKHQPTFPHNISFYLTHNSKCQTDQTDISDMPERRPLRSPLAVPCKNMLVKRVCVCHVSQMQLLLCVRGRVAWLTQRSEREDREHDCSLFYIRSGASISSRRDLARTIPHTVHPVVPLSRVQGRAENCTYVAEMTPRFTPSLIQ